MKTRELKARLEKSWEMFSQGSDLMHQAMRETLKIIQEASDPLLDATEVFFSVSVSDKPIAVMGRHELEAEVTAFREARARARAILK